MTSPVITLQKDTPLYEAAIDLSEQRISGALVVDYGDRPLGVVSLFDVVTYLSGLTREDGDSGGFYRYSYPKFREGGEGWERGWEEIEESKLRETPVAEIMTPDIISVDEAMPLPEVVRTMARRHIHRIFVTRAGKPAGVISTMDVFRALAGHPRRKARAIAKR
jgi:signal-transduction protein with cAMP-binding, CBS, and nucleotidyltransferase domain